MFTPSRKDKIEARSDAFLSEHFGVALGLFSVLFVLFLSAAMRTLREKRHS